MNEGLRYITLIVLFIGSILFTAVAQVEADVKAQSGDVARGNS